MNTSQKLTLDGELTIFRAAELKEQILPMIGAHEWEIDLAGVTEVDSAGIQLLLFAKKSTGAADGTMRLVNHSEAVVEALDLFNLHGYFGDPVLLTSTTQGAQA